MPAVRAAAVSPDAPPSAAPKLADLPIMPFLNSQGRIFPRNDGDAAASVFAVYNEDKRMQYIGFSKDLRNSLRSLFSRCSDYCFYFRYVDLQEMDQAQMLATREQWIAENKGTPVGLTVAMRDTWQKPIDTGTGAEKAARQRAKAVMDEIRNRGCLEPFELDPAALAEGKVDFLPLILSAEELAAIEALEEAQRESTQQVDTSIAGTSLSYTLRFDQTIQTNGGFIYDVVIDTPEQESEHRVICHQKHIERFGVSGEEIAERCLSYLLTRPELPQHTEGPLAIDCFPVNYFAVGQVEQWYPDFAEACFGPDVRKDGGLEPWRFNKVADFGPKIDSKALIGPDDAGGMYYQ